MPQKFNGRYIKHNSKKLTDVLKIIWNSVSFYEKDDRWCEIEEYESFLFSSRFQVYFDRPRMYLFTYAYDNKDANELYSGTTYKRYLECTLIQWRISIYL